MRSKKEKEEERKGCREVTQTLRWHEENVEKWNWQPTYAHTCTLMEFHGLASLNAMLGNIGGESVDGWKRGEISCSLTSARQ